MTPLLGIDGDNMTNSASDGVETLHQRRRESEERAIIVRNQQLTVVKSDDNHLDAKIPILYEKDLVVYNLMDNSIVQLDQIFIIL